MEPIILIPILCILIAGFITIRYKEVSYRRERFDNEYSEFSKQFFDFKDVLESDTISLNAYLLSEFGRHKRAKDIFIHNLKGGSLKRFNKKWAQYENENNQIKQFGVFAAVTAIPPENTGTDDPAQWEHERKIKIHRIIQELLKIAKIKIWL